MMATRKIGTFFVIAINFSLVAAATPWSPTIDGARYPKLDAMIGAGWMLRRLTLSEMKRIDDCHPTARNLSAELLEDEGHDLDEMVNNIVQTVLATQAENNQGRVIEYVDAEVQLEDNYEANVRGVTLACASFNNHITDFDSSDNMFGMAAYASHMVLSTTFSDGDLLVPTERGQYAYNISMLMHADVLDLGATGVLYVPEQYCLDFVEGDRGVSTTEPEGDIYVGSASLGIRKSIDMGSKTNTLTFTQNRVPWVYKSKEIGDDFFTILKAAYKNPKAELIALIDVLADPNITCATLGDCMFWAYAGFESKYPNLSFDPNTLEVTVSNFLFMKQQYDDFVASQILEANITNMFAAPYIFSKSLATTKKNGFFVNYANPFYTREELLDKISFSAEQYASDSIFQCMVEDHGNHKDTMSGVPTEALSAALIFEACMARRLYEFDKTNFPRSNLSDWGTLANAGSSFLDTFDQQYLAQNVTWDKLGDLMEGNLTEKIMGKTAEWIQVTNFADSTPLQKLWEDHDQSALEAFSRAASDAVETSNPCNDAATNGEIYLLVFGMAVAACGGVNAVLHSVHIFFHWLYGSNKARVSPATSFWARLLPTYELFLVFVGTLIFGSLYIPIGIQVQTELEVSGYHSSQADAVVDYGELQSSPIGGRPILVTLVYVETTCNDARPGLLIGLLVVGLFIGVVVNLPYAFLAWKACDRYFSRLIQTEDRVPEGTTPQDKLLRLFEPGYVWSNPSSDRPPEDEENIFGDIEQPNLLLRVALDSASAATNGTVTSASKDADTEDQAFLDALEHQQTDTPKDEDGLKDEDSLVNQT